MYFNNLSATIHLFANRFQRAVLVGGQRRYDQRRQPAAQALHARVQRTVKVRHQSAQRQVHQRRAERHLQRQNWHHHQSCIMGILARHNIRPVGPLSGSVGVTVLDNRKPRNKTISERPTFCSLVHLLYEMLLRLMNFRGNSDTIILMTRRNVRG